MASRRLSALLTTFAVGICLGGCAGGASLPSPDLLSNNTTAAPAPDGTTAAITPVVVKPSHIIASRDETGPPTPVVEPVALPTVDSNSRGGSTVVDPLGEAASIGVTGTSFVPGTLVSVYSRMAAGLNRCWLREDRPLGKTYVLHASIAPAPSTTGNMTVHLRSPSGRRGLKAFRVELSELNGQTKVTTTNLKLLPQQSSRVTRDLLRWAISGSDCGAHASGVPSPPKRPRAQRSISSAF